jgi:hypothetical protein
MNNDIYKSYLLNITSLLKQSLNLNESLLNFDPIKSKDESFI